MTAEILHGSEASFPSMSAQADIVPLVRPEETLTPDEFELAMRIASFLSGTSIASQKAVAELALFEAEQNNANETVLAGLRHNVRMWRTVQIDTIPIPYEAHHSPEFDQPED